MSIDNDFDHNLWEPLPDIPHASDDAFRGYAMASARNTIYISGGNTNGGLLSYDVTAKNKKWTTLPDMICHRWGHGLVVINGGSHLFAIGGWSRNCKQSNDAASTGIPAKTKASFHKSTEGIAKTKSSFHKSTESREKSQQREILGSFEVYDVSRRRWKLGGMLNEPRRDFATSVDSTSGKVYVFGGTGVGGNTLASAEVYDPHAHKWRLLTPMPRPCRQMCHALRVGNNRIHVFDGGSEVLTYDTIADEWSNEPPDESYIPKCPTRGHVCSSSSSSASPDDGAAIVYGYIATETDGSLTSRWIIAYIARKERRSKSWTVVPPANAFVYYRMVVVGGRLVMAVGNSMLAFQIVDDAVDNAASPIDVMSSCSSLGSTVNASSSGGLSSGSDWGLDESTKEDGKWKVQPQISLKHPDFRGYAVASAGSKIYISGGFSGDGSVHKTFVSYNVKKKKWKNLANMTHHRLGHRMVVSHDGRHVYVLGGGGGKTMQSLGVDIYNVKRMSWTVGPAMNTYRVFFGVAVCLGKLLAFGGMGSNGGNELGSVESYDPKTNCWKYETPMPEVRGVCNAIAIGRIVYVFGTPSQKVLTYDIATGEWLDGGASLPGMLPEIPPGGCVCTSSSHASGEVLVTKRASSSDQRISHSCRTAHVYNARERAWSSVHLPDEFACYSAVVAADKIVVVTPQNQLMACRVSNICS